MSKLTLAAVAGIGFLAGSRAGREPYDQFAAAVAKVRQNPRVKQATAQAQDVVAEKASEVANQAATAVKEQAASAAEAVRGSRSNGGTPEPGAR